MRAHLVVFLYRYFLLFAFLGIVFVPFSFRLWTPQAAVSQWLFEGLIVGIANQFESIVIRNPELTSDATSLYLLFFILSVLSLLSLALIYFFKLKEMKWDKIVKLLQLVILYYLALMMLKYGFDKLFKAQFYLPEPNTLYTPLGMLDKDILFWSTMGSSYSYNIFMGLMELFPAVMLLYKRTRVVALLLLSGVLLNVLWINFSFDVSVKLYSSFLLLLSQLLLIPFYKSIYNFFILRRLVQLTELSGQQLLPSKSIWLGIKSIILLFFFWEALWPYVKTGHYNDDTVVRNFLHGAYHIEAVQHKDTRQVVEGNNLKRLFIHRDDYFIFQYDDDSMEDFKLVVNDNQFVLTNYDGDKIELYYSYDDSRKTLELFIPTTGWMIYAKVLDWRELPLMQPLFHWTVDGVS